MTDLLRFILSAILMVLGVSSILLSVLGVFKFRFVLNRMHCAAVVDTMGVLCILLSLAVANGGLANIAKLLIILALVWVGSPISSHLLARMEVSTDPELTKHMKIKEK